MSEAGEAAPAEVLAFWREADEDRWYGKDSLFDDEVRRRFLGLWAAAAAAGSRPGRRATTARWR
jgi:uncharacterized protein (DUF924 family)